MGLPRATGRREIHHRVIDMRAYEREDGLYDVEAHLVDTKPFSYTRFSADEMTPAGQPIHDLWVRLTFDHDFVVTQIDAAAESGAPFIEIHTGWNGTGKRISIKATRAIIDAILDGSIEDAEFVQLPYFNLAMPTSLHGVDDVSMLDPRNTYVNAADWDGKAKDLAKRFVDNFVKFTDNDEGKALVAAGPQL